MMPSTRRLMRARIFSGSLVVQGTMRKPALWSSATLTAGLGPRRGASLGESVGGGAAWALAGGGGGGGGPGEGFRREGVWGCRAGMVKRGVAAIAAARMEISMMRDDSGFWLKR